MGLSPKHQQLILTKRNEGLTDEEIKKMLVASGEVQKKPWPTPQKDFANTMLNALPAIGSTLGIAGGTAAGGPGVGFAGGVGGAGVGNFLKQMGQGFLNGTDYNPTQQAQANIQGGIEGLTGATINKVGGFLASKAPAKELFSKFSVFKKGVIPIKGPEGIIGSLGEAKKPIGQEINAILDAAVNKRVPVSQLVSDLNAFAKRIEGEGVPEAVSKIREVIARVTSKSSGPLSKLTTNPKFAQAIKVGLEKDIYGEAGKELTKRGAVGIAEKGAKQISAKGLAEGVTTAVPQAKAPLDLYGQMSNIQHQMGKPFQVGPYGVPMLAGSLVSDYIPSGGAQALSGLLKALTLGTIGYNSPYIRLISRELANRGVTSLANPLVAGVGGTAFGSGLNNYLGNRGQ